MRGWKHLLFLLAGFATLGVLAPMVNITQGRVAMEFSAYRLSFDLEREYALLDRQLPRAAEKHLPASFRSTRRDVRLISEAARWAALAYVPAALLTLLGFLGILRRRFGRVLGTFSLLLGLASIGTWLALHFGLQLALREAELRQTQVSLLFGAHLLLLAGAAGVLAGLGALIRPDLGRPSRPAHPPGSAYPPSFPPPPMPPPPGPPPGFPPPPMSPPGLPPEG